VSKNFATSFGSTSVYKSFRMLWYVVVIGLGDVCRNVDPLFYAVVSFHTGIGAENSSETKLDRRGLIGCMRENGVDIIGLRWHLLDILVIPGRKHRNWSRGQRGETQRPNENGEWKVTKLRLAWRCAPPDFGVSLSAWKCGAAGTIARCGRR